MATWFEPAVDVDRRRPVRSRPRSAWPSTPRRRARAARCAGSSTKPAGLGARLREARGIRLVPQLPGRDLRIALAARPRRTPRTARRPGTPRGRRAALAHSGVNPMIGSSFSAVILGRLHDRVHLAASCRDPTRSTARVARPSAQRMSTRAQRTPAASMPVEDALTQVGCLHPPRVQRHAGDVARRQSMRGGRRREGEREDDEGQQEVAGGERGSMRDGRCGLPLIAPGMTKTRISGRFRILAPELCRNPY